MTKLTESRYGQLSKRERQATPLLLAQYLVSEVRRIHKCDTVAALWVMSRSVYYCMWEVDCWGISRDARTYAGPHPIIAHPPCGPWGSMAHWDTTHSLQDGLIAIDLVHKYGGVVEHPSQSTLFRAGLPDRVTYINQCDYGLDAIKPTGLYWVDNPIR